MGEVASEFIKTGIEITKIATKEGTKTVREGMEPINQAARRLGERIHPETDMLGEIAQAPTDKADFMGAIRMQRPDDDRRQRQTEKPKGKPDVIQTGIVNINRG